jgi:23S rRNA (uracil1939-C5)-methyltransferase
MVTEKRRYAQGELEAVLVASPDRIEPACPHYAVCGGCSYQHVDYAAELDFKREVARASFARLARLETVPLREVLPSPEVEGYRRKVTWRVEHGASGDTVGFIGADHRRLVDIAGCRLICPELQRLTAAFRQELQQLPAFSGCVTLRWSDAGAAMILYCDRPFPWDGDTWRLTQPGLRYLKVQAEGREPLIWGEPDLTQTLGELIFHYAPESFFQVNPRQAETLCRLAADYLPDLRGKTLLDVYCGVGMFALWLGETAGQVVGLEGDAAAVRSARLNACRQGRTNARFYAGNCDATGLAPIWEAHRPEAVVFDPPRSGLPLALCRFAADRKAPAILYVSCDLGTLARDVRRFADYGYRVQSIQPVDMFPRTYHVETIVLLQRETL